MSIEDKKLELEKTTLETIFESAPDVIFCKDLGLNFSKTALRVELWAWPVI